MEWNADNLVKMIGLYTNQIEKYEAMSTWFAAFSIGCVAAFLTFAAAFIVRKYKEGGNTGIYDSIISGIFLAIPPVTTLYLYVFAMNMRKVALYRGFLCFLENMWNDIAGKNILLFDAHIMTEFYSPGNFLVNGAGPVVMALFVIFSAVIGFGMSASFRRKLPDSKVKRGLSIISACLGVVCILFAGICCYYLSINESVTRAVVSYCEAHCG